MSGEIGYFTKVKLGIWFLFNKSRYLEYVESLNHKLVIFNKWFFDDETSTWYLDIMTSNGEHLQHSAIKEGKLEFARQFYGQEAKVIYNGTFGCNYDLVTIEDGEFNLEYNKAYELYLASYDEDAPRIFLFDMILAFDRMEEVMKMEGEEFTPTIEEVYDFSHIEKEA
jgi:hypothetical protein